ncbi:MAG: Crp/Fnr family transcriptional regulator [Hyphomonadaceae bacterium]|nr:Crp/Fnr family transcriptional regulator [Hyphomonadaceae bacterium]
MRSLLRHRDRIRPFLANNTFLGRLPDIVIDELISKGQLKSLAKGAVVYRRGDPGDSLNVVVKGRFKLANTTIHGKEIVLYYVGPGEIFGEIAALDGKERAVDTVALEDSEIFVVHTRDLLPTLSAHPPAMLEIVQALCEKIRIGAAIIEDNTLEMRGRTARGLLRLARRYGRTSADGAHLQLVISQEELGKFLGMSRANVNRQLGQLKLADVIRISGTEISIVDETGLVDIAEAPAAKD